ncbi:MAG: DUF2817 domain-containing protein [Bdellovibrionales bacterium]|nr:DUF2817 domain-containing protein [Ramlibacter sp.]
MTAVADAFSGSYRQARAKFLDAAATAGLQVRSHVHPGKGRDGEELAMDVALDGPAHAGKLLIVTSACHGVEGYCGSGVQVLALGDAAWRDKARTAGVAVLYVHALNPYGFSHIRRATQENVDLNRNFHDYAKPLPANEAYREIHSLLLPEEWPPTEQNAQAVAHYLATRGLAAWQAAISAGQREFADGMFFGGTGPCWSNTTFRQVLRDHAQDAARVAWIDIHTGLGPSGVGERIFAGRDDAAAIARARQWWGNQVTSIYDGTSTSALLTGMVCAAAYEECPQAEYTGIAMEYGTVPVLEVMQALRAEHWLHNHPDAPAALAADIKRQMMQAFYTDTGVWKEQVAQQAREALLQAVDGLAGT